MIFWQKITNSVASQLEFALHVVHARTHARLASQKVPQHAFPELARVVHIAHSPDQVGILSNSRRNELRTVAPPQEKPPPLPAAPPPGADMSDVSQE